MAETPVPITPGTGGASIASDLVGGNSYQQIKVVDATIGSSNAWKINGDGSAQVSVFGTVNTATQGSIAAVIIGGSITASFTPSANQSVSGTVGASIIGTVPVTGFPTTQNISGSVAAFIVGNSSIITIGQGSVAAVIIGGSITASFTAPANQSVSGTVGASIIGITPVNLTNPSGSLQVGAQQMSNDGVSAGATGIITANFPYVYNGTNYDRWRGNSSIGALVSTGQSSVIVLIQGSVATVGTAAANQSVSGTVGASIIGTVPVVQSGTVITSLVSNTPSSVLVGASIFGQLPAGTAMIGSVTAIQGTSPWAVAGSVFAVVQGLQGASVSGSVGIVGNPSISGTVNIGGTATVTGSVSAILAPYSASTQGITSVMTGTTSVLVLAAPSGTQRNYITHVLVTNAAAVGTVVTIQDGASILWGGFAAASGGGWSENFNPPLPQPTSVKALYATSATAASVFVAVNGFTGT